MINYDAPTEIIVKTQEELDMIPLSFKGRIYIEFGTSFIPAIVRNEYTYRVVARGSSSVVAWENSSVEAWGNSSVEAYGNSNIAGGGNAQIVDRLCGGRIEITGNARIVYIPKGIEDYCSFYDLEHNKKKGKFYKCVHKRNGRYFSDHDSGFEYVIGEKVFSDKFTDDPYEDCGYGIHVAYMAWVLDFGRSWNDLAIIEVEAKFDDVIVPNGQLGKVRCREVTVLREVPLEECGLYGKMLARRNNKS